MKKIILLLVAIVFLSSKIPTWAATSCRGKSDCPSGYECVYWDNSGTPRIDSSNNAESAFCAKIYQEVTRAPTRIPPTPKYAKEGEFCGAGPNGVVQCEPGLKCDESRNRISEDSSEGIGAERVGAGGVCVKITPIVKPTIIDNCRLKICGDANCDEVVNSLDLTIWKKESTSSEGSKTADFNSDGKVDEADYELLKLGLEKKCEVTIPTPKYAKEGEFCGAGPNGVVQCEPGLKCDESRNRISEDSSEGIGAERVGAGGVCVKITPIVKPTIIDNCRLKICGDANCDGKLDTMDRLAWVRERLRSGAKTADFNKDGKIDTKDYTLLTSGIQGKCQPIIVPITKTPVPTNKPTKTPIDTKICNTDNDCLSSEYCYQPPMPTCPKGQNCLDVMPQKYCRTVTKVTLMPTSRLTPTRAPTIVPTLETKKYCESEADCSRIEECYQPPMPTCSPGVNCVQVLPRKYCKPVVVSEVTGVEDKTTCKESKGDANRDGKYNLTDYAIWRYEYAKGTVSKTDFNCDKKVDTIDFKIWRETFLETKGLMVTSEN